MHYIMYIAIGGAIGAVTRYLCVEFIAKFSGNSSAAYGVMGVNILGSFIMGGLAAYLLSASGALAQNMRFFLGVGVLGSFTTFSTFSLDALRLFEQGHLAQFSVYVVGSVALSLCAVCAGYGLYKIVMT